MEYQYCMASLPPQHHRPFSSRNMLSWHFSESNNFLGSKFIWSISVQHQTVLQLTAALMALLLLNIFTALMMCSGSYQSPEATEPFTLYGITNSVLDFSGGQIVYSLLLAFNSLEHFSGISVGPSASFKVRLPFNQSGPYHHKQLNCNSAKLVRCGFWLMYTSIGWPIS